MRVNLGSVFAVLTGISIGAGFYDRDGPIIIAALLFLFVVSGCLRALHLSKKTGVAGHLDG